jgi:DNA/RNA endonuclease G (NUC1)
MSYTIKNTTSINTKSFKDNFLNDLTNYKSIFSHNRKSDKSIILLKKTEFDIFYSCRRKYPILVKESINANTGLAAEGELNIDRRQYEDPFREDFDIPQQYRHTLADYKAYMAYGGSMGHNAPAGQHKTNMTIWSETFLLSNITPQEMVFNSGLWVIMENWCKNLKNNIRLDNITVFTGSIPANKNSNLDSNLDSNVKMNIPDKMFKIICFTLPNQLDTTYLDILIANNSAYYVHPNTKQYDLTKFIIPYVSHKWFQNYSGISINSLLEYYNLPTKHVKSFANKVINMKFNMSPAMRTLMLKSNWFGYIIYSKSVQDIDNVWDNCQQFEKEFETLRYHQEFYKLVRNRLLKGKKSSISAGKSGDFFRKTYNKLSKKIIHISRTVSRTGKKTKTKSKSKH